jgi:hypothetical protein
VSLHEPATQAAHPEILRGEVFVGNFTNREFAECRWKSKRRGNVAYRPDGSPASTRLRPVFVAEMEVVAAGYRIKNGHFEI